MTTWTDQSTINTSWNAADRINQDVSILYNVALPYDVDYISYDGYYIEANIDWVNQSTIETAWRDEA